MDDIEHPAAPVTEPAAAPIPEVVAPVPAEGPPAPADAAPEPPAVSAVVWIKPDFAVAEPVHVVHLPRDTAEGLEAVGLVRPATDAERAASAA